MKKFYIGMLLAAGVLCMAGCGTSEVAEPANTEVDTAVVSEEEIKTADAEVEPETDAKEAADADEEQPQKELSLSEVKKACKVLMKNLQDYEYAVLDDVRYSDGSWLEVGQQVTIDLDTREITRAAGFSLPYNYSEEFEIEPTDSGTYRVATGEPEEFPCYAVELSQSDVNTAARNLFGKEADIDSLPMSGNSSGDVIRLDDEPEIVVSMYVDCETDTDFVRHESSIKKGKKGYIFNQKVYFGYWGCNDEKSSNYVITYGIQQNEASEYGFIITSMKVKRIADETDWHREDESIDVVDVSDSPEPFYGIWCYGVKSESDAQKGVEELQSKGLDGDIFVTTDWSNLNSEKWYVVTAGVYYSEEDAKDALPDVKNAGYSGAYVQYTGD